MKHGKHTQIGHKPGTPLPILSPQLSKAPANTNQLQQSITEGWFRAMIWFINGLLTGLIIDIAIQLTR